MNRPSRNALIRYFRGKSPSHEIKLVEIYLAMSIDNDYVESCLKEAWTEAKTDETPQTDDNDLEEFKRKVHLRKAALKQLPKQTRRPNFTYMAAASVLLLGVCTFLYFFMLRPTTENPMVYLGSPNGPTAIRLADSSEIILFPGAKLEVSNSYNQADRKVNLNGRAFFNVSHDEQRPFLVTSLDGLTTEVLGTSFEINPLDVDDNFTVTLHTGKVGIGSQGRQLTTLQPKQQFSYDKAKQVFHVQTVDVSRGASWINGELEYELEPLSTIFRDMEQWYGVEITVSNPELRDRKITTSFTNEPIESVLDILSETSGLNYQIKGKKVKIK